MDASEKERQSAVARVLLRVGAAVVGGLLVLWAFVILRNIWGYNDSGTFLYVYVVVYGVPGLLLLLFAAGVIPRRRTPAQDSA